jgi:hypothetical protein
MSATHNTLGRSGVNRRSTRSVAGVIPGIRIVVRHRFRGLTPEIPTAFISRATRLRPTQMPCSIRSSAPGRSIHAPAGLMDPLDLVGQPRIRERPIRRRSTPSYESHSPAGRPISC